MSLYAWLLVITLLGPLGMSFDKKIHFHTYFKPLFASIFIIAFAFIVWDQYFTQKGIWGFNIEYLSGYFIGDLPIEEICFFIIVPFACFFIYEVLKGYFPALQKQKLARIVAFVFGMSGLGLGIQFMENWYTASACILSALLTIGIYFVRKEKWYPDFIFTYLVALVPFVVINGFLTGMATPTPVVWYNEMHIMGPRIITIPIEDLYYNYDMLICIAFIYEFLKKKRGDYLQIS